MSLAFLAKKSWHTTNFKNVEKVWMAEQRGEEEKKKVIELQKQIAEERQIQELRQLQAASGHVVKIVDNTLDWMYEGPAAEKIQQQSTDEYLLGKTYTAKEEKSELQKVGQSVGSTWLNKTSSKNDMFTRLHEDPMLLIKQNEKKSLENVLKNPLKMEYIRESVAAQLNQRESEKREKKAAKKLKKSITKEGKRKHEKRERSRSSSSGATKVRESAEDFKSRGIDPAGAGADGRGKMERQRSRSRDRGRDSQMDMDSKSYAKGDERRGSERRPRSRSRDCGRDRDDQTHAKGDERRGSERRPRSRSRDRGRDRDDQTHAKGDERRGSERRPRSRSRDRGRDRDDQTHAKGDERRGSERRPRSRSRDRGRDRDDQTHAKGDERRERERRPRSRSRDRGRNREIIFRTERNAEHSHERHITDEGQSGKRRDEQNSDGKVGRNQIDGDSVVRQKPSEETDTKKYGLLSKGDDEIKSSSKDYMGPSLALLSRKAEEERLEKLSKNKPRENVKRLTDEERKARIKQMESDATHNNDSRQRKMESTHPQKHDTKDDPANEEASFIKSMRSEVYVTSNTSMKDRLDQNRHYVQKGNDLDSAGFLKR